jgi:hypothetical protein
VPAKLARLRAQPPASASLSMRFCAASPRTCRATTLCRGADVARQRDHRGRRHQLATYGFRKRSPLTATVTATRCEALRLSDAKRGDKSPAADRNEPSKMLRPDLRPEGQYSRKVQQRPHCLTRSASSRCVLSSANMARNDYCAEFGTKRSQVQILSPRPLFGLVREHFDCGARVDQQSLSD